MLEDESHANILHHNRVIGHMKQTLNIHTAFTKYTTDIHVVQVHTLHTCTDTNLVEEGGGGVVGAGLVLHTIHTTYAYTIHTKYKYIPALTPIWLKKAVAGL